jgi:hypothetical protein
MLESPGQPRLQETIGRTLAHQAEGAGALGAVLGTWRETSNRLTPVIGTGGVDALFRRALHVAGRAFPWFAPPTGEGLPPLEHLRACLAQRDEASTLASCTALLVIFYELLETMIGASLTGRLLDPLWSPPAPAPPEERAP